MLINGEGQVFVAQRIDSVIDAWQMPQGGIDKGEDPRSAALRELEEETGVSSNLVSILAETSDWICYDFPDDVVDKVAKGRFRGQKQRWFLMRFLGSDDHVQIQTEHPEFSKWKWANAASLEENIVAFKRHIYRSVVAEFQDHLG